MRNLSLRQRCGVLFLLAGLLIRPAGAGAREVEPDWWAAQQEVAARLAQPESNLGALVKQVCQTAPADGQAAMLKLCVLARTGMNKDIIQALHELKQLCPALPSYQVSSIYYNACDHLQAWDVAEAAVTIFADSVSELSLDNRLLQHFQKSGWTVERIDAWLAARPKGIRNFWVKERLRFNMIHERGEALEKELADQVRANPRDMAGAMDYLDAVVYAGAGQPKLPDLAWVATTLKPELASDAGEIASRFARLNDWPDAALFYRQAIAIPLTAEEVKRLGSLCQIFMPEPVVRASFAAQTREGLAECLLKMEQAAEAQKWMLEAADIRTKNQLGRNALFAGQVQNASGERAIEGEIKAEEKLSENEPKYWQERAQYYRGRKEAAEEEAALRKGLALTTPQPEPARMTKGHFDWRSRLLSDYARFLAREKRDGEAFTLLHQELAEAPANSESAARAANLLAFDFAKQLQVDDAVLWHWLENRPKWEYTEERLLWRMLENAKREELNEPFIRAEKLAAESDASRALEPLANAGLRDELIAFYGEMQQAIPSSDIPAKVLETLRKQEVKKSDSDEVK